MPKDALSKERKRMVVVEEVSSEPEVEVKPQEAQNAPEPASSTDQGSSGDKMPLEEVKEKVEELQNITHDIGESVEKSAEVKEEIVRATEKATAPDSSKEPERPEVITAKAADSGYRDSKGPGIWIILVPGVLLLGALLGGILFYQKSIQSVSETKPTPTAEIDVTASPSASPSGKIDLTKYPINVQNGSGIPGTASSAKDLLTKEGFKVSAAGNADTYDYTDTIIKIKEGVPAEFVTKLTTALSGVFSVGTPKTLPQSSDDEVVVIIGSTKAQ